MAVSIRVIHLLHHLEWLEGTTPIIRHILWIANLGFSQFHNGLKQFEIEKFVERDSLFCFFLSNTFWVSEILLGNVAKDIF